jgi:hypothetical protein
MAVHDTSTHIAEFESALNRAGEALVEMVAANHLSGDDAAAEGQRKVVFGSMESLAKLKSDITAKLRGVFECKSH